MKYLTLITLALLTSNIYSQKILYSELNNENWDIYSLSVKDGVINKITHDSLKDFQSDYSNIRESIIFDSYRDENTRNIFTFNPKNKEIIQLTNLDTRDGHPVWSADGSKIAFQSSRTGNPEVFIMDYKGENIEQLTTNKAFDGIPKWSANDKFLAFNSNRDGSPNVFTIDIETKKITQVTANKSYNFIQDWISENEILIITDVEEKRQMQIIDLKGTVIKTINTEGNVTYARGNQKGQIVFTEKSINEEFSVNLIDVKSNKAKQLTNSKTEKRFPAFLE